MKKKKFLGLIVFLFSVILILFNCSLGEKEQEGNTLISADQPGPMTVIRNYYLDKSIKVLGLDDSAQITKSSGVMSVNEKYELLKNYFEPSRTKAGLMPSGDDRLLEDVCTEMENSIRSIKMIVKLKDGTTVDLTGKSGGNINDADYSKQEILSLVDEKVSPDKGVWKVGDWKWPSGNVVYRLCNNLSDAEKGTIRNSMSTWASSTGRLSFSEIEDAWYNELFWALGLNYHVKIDKASDLNGAGGVSTLGYGPWKYISLLQVYDSTVLHEMGHTLGLYHEHQRYDRDQYIEINWPNIIDRFKYAFDLIPKDNVLGFYLIIDINLFFFTFHWEGWIELARWENSRITEGYDYMSIMQYPSSAFSKGDSNWTIRRKIYSDEYERYNLRGYTLTSGDIGAIQSIY